MRARRLLLVPLLVPLLAVLLVAALNPSPKLSFRLLTWVTPRAPLGAWLAAAALGGAALSGAGTALALRQGSPLPARRRTFRRVPEPWPEGGTAQQGWPSGATEPGRGTRWEVRPPSAADGRRGVDRPAEAWRNDQGGVAPQRSPGDPAPTLEAPFRILRRPPTTPEPALAVDAVDDWGSPAIAEDW